MKERYCLLCKKNISDLHRRCIRCSECQKEIRRYQNNSIAPRERKNPAYRKTVNRYVVLKTIADKIEAGELDIKMREWSYSALRNLYFYLNIKEKEEKLEISYLNWMKAELEKLKVKLEP